uniref:Uncharacterized protein n=1 Tax=Curvibacter symbiont subsp. Hydra magnipapillata TaxID=667019 RepID=C9Y934_CURXX|nr:hypothetical protein Csp_A06350 [Curvibacter putative symbiont of Hydra magnipapillata]
MCDRCGRQAERDDMDCEFHEFMSIQNRAGYGSIFGDGNRVDVDLCQHCVKDTLGAWIRITDPLDGYSQDEHGGDFPDESERSFRARAKANIAKSIVNDDGVPADHVIANLAERLDQVRSEKRQRQLIEQSGRPSSSNFFGIGTPVFTNKSIPDLDLEAGAYGSVIHVHDTTDLVDVEFFNDADESTSVRTVEVQYLNAWKLK